MQRRDFVTSVLVGGLVTQATGDGQAAGNDQQEQHGAHHHGKRDAKSTNYTVSFGHWLPTPTTTPTQTESPIDRFAPADPNPRFLNSHNILPNDFRIRVGDTVTFAISGFHLVLIYRRTKPEDINRTILSPALPPPPPPAVPPAFPPLIADTTNRLYRGLDPRTMPTNQDRIEVVGFNTRGRHLVICGVLPHFFDPGLQDFLMYGYIDVRND